MVEEPESAVTDVGVKPMLTPEGAPLALRLTLPVNALSELALTM